MLNACQMHVKLERTQISSFVTPACKQTRATREVARSASAREQHAQHKMKWVLCGNCFSARKNISIHVASKRTLFVWSWSDRGKVRQYLNASFLYFLGLYFCDICFQNRDEDWIFFVVLQVPSLVILWARLLRKAVKTHGMKKALASRSQFISFRGVVNWARRSRFLDIGCERQPCPCYRRWKVFPEYSPKRVGT